MRFGFLVKERFGLGRAMQGAMGLRRLGDFGEE
jgi:hypothetical protein